MIYIHGNKATHGWRFAWAPWLQGALRFYEVDTVFETMPDSVDGRAKYWLPFMARALDIGPQDVIVGWSTGAAAAMRYAESHPVRGLVLVAPHHTDLGSPFEKASGWFTTPWEWHTIRDNTGSRAVFHGDNDALVPMVETRHIVSSLGAEGHCVAGAGHFIHLDRVPEMLDYLLRML